MTGSMHWSNALFFRCKGILDLKIIEFLPNALHASFILLLISGSSEPDLCMSCPRYTYSSTISSVVLFIVVLIVYPLVEHDFCLNEIHFQTYYITSFI